MGVLSVLIAGVAAFGFGAAWYNLHGKRWMAAVGTTEEELKSRRDPTPFVIAAVASLLSAGMMRHIFVTSDVSGAWAGLISGLGIGVFMVAPWIVLNCAFSQRPRDLWWIDAGFAALVTGVIGLVLGLFG